MRTGIYGGTFNPVHNGHLGLAGAYLQALSLDRLLVIPTRVPPHKTDEELIGGMYRLRMCELAFRGFANVQVCDIEIRRPETSFTVDTLEELHRLYPSDTFYLLMGSDMFLTLAKWRSYRRILELAVICAGARDPADGALLKAQKERLEAQGARCVLIPLEPLPLSSTDVRRQVAGGRGAYGLVPDAVAAYIDENGLYRPRGSENLTKGDAGMKLDLKKFEKLAKKKLSAKRFYHTQCVVKQAELLAKHYGCDAEKAMAAAWLHDLCKEMKPDEQLQWCEKSGIMLDSVQRSQPKTWHGMAAAGYIRLELGIEDPEICSAVRYHTTARGDMTLLDEVVYLADLTSAERDYPDVKRMRELAFSGTEQAMKEAMRYAVSDLCEQGYGISRDTFEAYNHYIIY